ncbi:hypothetical protein RHS97_001847 [Klebsiella oxytoca]|nr:hypothetical protein [Klebsiella oxytoca]
MTSKLTRERIEWLNYAATGLAANGTEMAMSPQDVIALTECCLAAMDSEPVAWQIHTPETGVTYVETNPQSVENIRNGFGVKVEITPLYRHAQPVVQMVAEESRCGTKATPALDSLPKNAESRSGNSLANDTNVVKRLTITLPDTSSKAFWSGTGKTETFHPVTYRRWVKEAIERYCAIARIDVEVK